MHLVPKSGELPRTFDPLGAMPVEPQDNEAETRKLCATCGTDLEQLRDQFDLGARHSLNVVYRKLVERGMTKELAKHFVLWVESDVEL